MIEWSDIGFLLIGFAAGVVTLMLVCFLLDRHDDDRTL